MVTASCRAAQARAVTTRLLFVLSAFLGGSDALGGEADPVPVPRLTVSIVAGEHGLLDIRRVGDHFHVVVLNTSAEPLRLWQMVGSWGRDSLYFDVLDEAGKVQHRIRPTWTPTRNVARAIEIGPGEPFVINVTFDGWWDLPFPPDELWGDHPLRMRAVYEIAACGQTKEQGVWTGRIVSPIRNYCLSYWLGHKLENAYYGTNVFPILRLLGELGTQTGQKERVLAWLRDLSKECHPLQQPAISYLMCRLGDRSHLPAVREGFFGGHYNSGLMLEPVGMPLGANAILDALRQLILYGTRDDHEKLHQQMALTDDPLRQGGEVCGIFAEFAREQPDLPESYWTDEFPFYLLIWALDYRAVTSNADKYDVRGCDQAAQAIQRIAKTDFGHRHETPPAERDRAIEAIRLWWGQTGRTQYRAK